MTGFRTVALLSGGHAVGGYRRLMSSRALPGSIEAPPHCDHRRVDNQRAEDRGVGWRNHNGVVRGDDPSGKPARERQRDMSKQWRQARRSDRRVARVLMTRSPSAVRPRGRRLGIGRPFLTPKMPFRTPANGWGGADGRLLPKFGPTAESRREPPFGPVLREQVKATLNQWTYPFRLLDPNRKIAWASED